MVDHDVSIHFWLTVQLLQKGKLWLYMWQHIADKMCDHFFIMYIDVYLSSFYLNLLNLIFATTRLTIANVNETYLKTK